MKIDPATELKKGKIGVIATDTIYGIVGSALIPDTVERIYGVRRRDPSKPMLILISSVSDLKKFDISFNSDDLKIFKKFWPGKVTIILPLLQSGVSKFKYLHRGMNTLAFRLPAKDDLISILKKAGPLVAPSANLEGKTPASNVSVARLYFGDSVDFYMAGRVSKKSSKIIELIDGNIKIIRS